MKFIFIHVYVVFYHLWDETKVLLSYYRDLSFAIKDLFFRWQYLFINPYKICRRQGYIYGETPLTTMDQIAKECGILSHDVVYDLGCGRGRNLFWLTHFVKCRAYGIDLCPLFIQKAKNLIEKMKLSRLSFELSNVTAMDFKEASVIYLYGTDFSDEVILKLIEKFQNKKLKIITVSFSLNEYDQRFEIKKQFKATFPWGKTDVYIQVPIIN